MYKNEKEIYIYVPPPTWNQLRTILKKKKNRFRSINLEELIIIPITRLKKIILQVYFHSNFYSPTCNLCNFSIKMTQECIYRHSKDYLLKKKKNVILFSLIYFKSIPILFFRLLISSPSINKASR